MKALKALIAAIGFFVISSAFARPVAYSPDGADAPSIPLAGEIQKLPKVGTKENFCGGYFVVGRTDDHSDALVYFILKPKEIYRGGKKMEIVFSLAVARGDMKVILDEEQPAPFATAMVVNGLGKIVVRISSREMRKATCLPKAPSLKGT